MRNVLLLTNMYPDPLRPATEVCHYFAREWVKMGYNVLVFNYRSMFPRIYTDLATLFPKLALKYVGSHVEMDRNMNIVQHEVEGIPVYSVPIFKYIPHGGYSRKEINKHVKIIVDILSSRSFIPDAIIGHFYNPEMPIITELKHLFPAAKTCVSLHELTPSVLKKNYPKTYQNMLDTIDIMGYRSVPIGNKFEAMYGPHKHLYCFSGVEKKYENTPPTCVREFPEGELTEFIYVGQFITRKYPIEVIQALQNVYNEKDFHLDCISKKEILFPKVEAYVNNNGLQNKVEFLGQISREDIIKYYDRAECFVLISSGEVFGLVYLEAMARGCITIASRDEGVDGIIEDGVNGFLCEAGHVEELESILHRINNMTAEEKTRISENGRKTALELSDYNVAKKYIEEVMTL